RKGSEHFGTLAIGNLALDGAAGNDAGKAKVATIEMAKAYAVDTLKSLTRTLALHPDGRVTLVDDYAFTQGPESIEEGFVTYETAQAASDGQSVTVGEGDARIT